MIKLSAVSEPALLIDPDILNQCRIAGSHSEVWADTALAASISKRLAKTPSFARCILLHRRLISRLA